MVKSSPVAARHDRWEPAARWAGAALVAGVTLTWGTAFAFLQVGCSSDCGDEGGRAAFALAMLASPLALAGTALIVRSLRREVASGGRPARPWRRVVTLVRVTVHLGAGVAACAAVVLLGIAVDALLNPVYGNGSREWGDPILSALLAILWAALAFGGVRAGRRLGRLLADWPDR